MLGSNLDKLSVEEKYVTKSCKIIHISLANRLSSLLSIDRVYLNEYETEDNTHGFCSKLIFIYVRTKRRFIGYVLQESEDTIIACAAGGNEYTMSKPKLIDITAT